MSDSRSADRKISDEVVRRNIQEVVHFTTNRGIVGILGTQSVLSRKRLPESKALRHILYPNSAIRPEEPDFFDRSDDWLDYVNLSISEINTRFFAASQRWHRESGIWWVIAAFDPVLMTHERVHFATTNNKYECCRRNSGLSGFSALFAPTVPRRPGWRARRLGRPDHLTTCEQAEVLYPVQLSADLLRRIYVREGPDCDRVRGWLREFDYANVEVVLDPAKFQGAPN